MTASVLSIGFSVRTWRSQARMRTLETAWTKAVTGNPDQYHTPSWRRALTGCAFQKCGTGRTVSLYPARPHLGRPTTSLRQTASGLESAQKENGPHLRSVLGVQPHLGPD